MVIFGIGCNQPIQEMTFVIGIVNGYLPSLTSWSHRLYSTMWSCFQSRPSDHSERSNSVWPPESQPLYFYSTSSCLGERDQECKLGSRPWLACVADASQRQLTTTPASFSLRTTTAFLDQVKISLFTSDWQFTFNFQYESWCDCLPTIVQHSYLHSNQSNFQC